MSDIATQSQLDNSYREKVENIQGGDILMGERGGEVTIIDTDENYDGYTAWTEFGTIILGYAGETVRIKRPLPN